MNLSKDKVTDFFYFEDNFCKEFHKSIETHAIEDTPDIATTKLIQYIFSRCRGRHLDTYPPAGRHSTTPSKPRSYSSGHHNSGNHSRSPFLSRWNLMREKTMKWSGFARWCYALVGSTVYIILI